VERDRAIYDNTDDEKDVRSVGYLVAARMLDRDIPEPGECADVMQVWNEIGRMVL
jgi:hypothetical protein